MKLKSVRLQNYKCHLDTEELQIGNKFTVFVGQNNSGKSSLLEAISLNQFTNRPHLSPQRGPFQTPQNPTSQLTVTLTVPGAELESTLLAAGGQNYIPAPPGSNNDQATTFLSNLFRTNLEFVLTRLAPGNWTGNFPSHRLFARSVHTISAHLNVGPDRQNWHVSQMGQGDSLPNVVGSMYQGSVYGFKAERLNIGASTISASADLATNASNLPSVLLHLSAVPDASTRYINLVREIFPTIYHVGAKPVSNDQAQIVVTMNDDVDGATRAGISISLSECGTGVGQVLALLYVVVTATVPKLVVIDEPNSFLHPGAAKKLITILKGFDHQYIVSTHSADLIRVIDPDVLHLVEWRKTETAFETLDRNNIRDQRKLLADLGVRLSDVFGADGIVWVEGPTEERCFPLILNYLGLLSPTISILSLVAVDDLTGKSRRAKLSWDLYRKMTNGTALIPPALAFSFDRDGRSLKNIEDMERASQGLAKFLPRRMYENYMIHPHAIAHVMSKFLDERVKESRIEEWLGSCDEQPYFSSQIIEDDDWKIKNLDGAKLLTDLFSDISDASIEFRKTEHSVALSEFILKHEPDYLSELFAYCKTLIPAR